MQKTVNSPALRTNSVIVYIRFFIFSLGERTKIEIVNGKRKRIKTRRIVEVKDQKRILKIKIENVKKEL